MLTLFSAPKPFRGHINIIQRNAIRSWTSLCPDYEVILFGDEEGTAEAAAFLGVRQVPSVALNDYGTPLVSDLFEQARALARNELFCYVNADIILMSDFARAVDRVARLKRRFLMVGQRWDLDVEATLDFESGWAERLRCQVTERGELHPPTGIDYFVSPKRLWGKIPPFAIGRIAWDNWALYEARLRKAALIDASSVVMAVHQNHGYEAPTPEGVWDGPEARQNLILAGGQTKIFTLLDATHLLTPTGLKRPFIRGHIDRHLATLIILKPHLRLPLQLLARIISFCRSIRSRLGRGLSLGGGGA